MAPRVRKPKDDDADGTGPAHGSNVPHGEQVLGFITRVENVNAEKASIMGTAMSECRALEADKKEIFKEAKAAGINKKALKGHVKRRELEGKIEDIRVDLEGDDQDSYDALMIALSKIADSGAGASA